MANLNLIKDIDNLQKNKGIHRKRWRIEERERERDREIESLLQ